jgi:hypothetical protein
MGFLTRALGKRITKTLDEFAQTPEGKATLERNDRKRALAEMATEIAGTGADDESACAMLRERLPDDPEPARDAIKYLAVLRTSYLDDRAFRLLSSVVDGTPVRRIDPTVEAQFSAEAQLGRMSLSDAFAYLVSLEPRLADPQTQRAESGQRRNRWRVGRPPPDLVGAWAREPPPGLEHRSRRQRCQRILRAREHQVHGGYRPDAVLRT